MVRPWLQSLTSEREKRLASMCSVEPEKEKDKATGEMGGGRKDHQRGDKIYSQCQQRCLQISSLTPEWWLAALLEPYYMLHTLYRLTSVLAAMGKRLPGFQCQGA